MHIPSNARLKLKHYGMASIQKFIHQRDTKETCADVKCDSGEILCLSLKYVEKVLARA